MAASEPRADFLDVLRAAATSISVPTSGGERGVNDAGLYARGANLIGSVRQFGIAAGSGPPPGSPASSR
jgi:hypothetical protein